MTPLVTPSPGSAPSWAPGPPLVRNARFGPTGAVDPFQAAHSALGKPHGLRLVTRANAAFVPPSPYRGAPAVPTSTKLVVCAGVALLSAVAVYAVLGHFTR